MHRGPGRGGSAAWWGRMLFPARGGGRAVWGGFDGRPCNESPCGGGWFCYNLRGVDGTVRAVGVKQNESDENNPRND
jgi:hypothetical protein